MGNLSSRQLRARLEAQFQQEGWTPQRCPDVRFLTHQEVRLLGSFLPEDGDDAERLHRKKGAMKVNAGVFAEFQMRRGAYPEFFNVACVALTMIIAGTWGSPVFWFRAVGEKEAIEARCYAIASLIFLLVAVCGVVLLVVEGYCRGIPAASGYDMHSVS
ncbi:unnamed protein product [Vitrella brassicaformis CCMP3155]|uniref:Uncharacterized protein n=1 Tax=Vitrella brassicaformis (strain CCMP3155) TaxID=1169540 RepID=A0A0G4FUN5_VITBC|nr:unnamed protein product [Vitrella brassicaformis CCMP3155]|eukprot:CEM18595.1 unnamed protein product [Vitrella brassicaformis CCMP3155]